MSVVSDEDKERIIKRKVYICYEDWREKKTRLQTASSKHKHLAS